MSANPDGTFEFDWTDFDRKFLEYATKIAPAAAEKGMFKAISELKNDSDNVTPRTPHLHGDLRGDYTFILEGITQSKVEDHGTKFRGGDAPAERYGANNIVAKIVFRMPYAAKWHEAVNRVVHWSEPGVGPKYLETKMMMFMKKYINIVAMRVREVTGGTT